MLRYWESEFRIKPKRSPAGQRLYRREHVERLLLIKRLLYTEGYTIAGAKRRLSRLRAKGEASGGRTGDSSEATTPAQGTPSGKQQGAWKRAVLEEVEALHDLIQKARQIEV